MKIEEQITLYPELSGEERAALEDYVATHPEWEPALSEAKRWDELLGDVRVLGQESTGDEALAYFVVTRRLQAERAPSEVTDLTRQIEKRIDSDPELAVRVAEMEARLRAVESASPASQHFERLRNRRRSASDARISSAPARLDRPSASGKKEMRRSDAEFDGASNGSARRPYSAPYVWRVMAAVIAAVALYGVLYAAGQLARAPHERLAEFEKEELTLEGFENVRSGDSLEEPTPAVAAYLDALEQLRGAESSFIGLFPKFNERRLDSAAVLLNDVIRSEPPESFLRGEAAFLLGKTELARGNMEAASRALSSVLVTGGRRASEARKILVDLGS